MASVPDSGNGLILKYAKRNSHLVKVIKQNQGSNEDAMIHTMTRQQLVSLCQTRFVERHEAVLVARQLLPSVVMALQDMVMWDSLETRKKARRLLNSIQKAEFLITQYTLGFTVLYLLLVMWSRTCA